MKSYIVATLCALLSLYAACNTSKHDAKRIAKATAKFDKIKRKCDADSLLKIVPPTWAHKNYPSRERVVRGKPVIIPGKPIIKPGKTITKYVDCDSVKKAGGTKPVSIDCPPADTIEVPVKEVTTDTVYQNDSALVLQLQIELRNASKAAEAKGVEASKFKEQATKYKASTAILSVILLAIIVVMVLYRRAKKRLELAIAALRGGKFLPMDKKDLN